MLLCENSIWALSAELSTEHTFIQSHDSCQLSKRKGPNHAEALLPPYPRPRMMSPTVGFKVTPRIYGYAYIFTHRVPCRRILDIRVGGRNSFAVPSYPLCTASPSSGFGYSTRLTKYTTEQDSNSCVVALIHGSQCDTFCHHFHLLTHYESEVASCIT